MFPRKRSLIALIPWLMLLLFSSGCLPVVPTLVTSTDTPAFTSATETATPSRSCKPTRDDGVSPSYRPDAPERTVVGKGHVLTGVVLSSEDCRPIPQAKLEFWPEEQGLGHPDSARATFYTDENGRYRFESNPPEHIHMRISAPGYRTVGVNSYHPDGQPVGVLDLVLEPDT